MKIKVEMFGGLKNPYGKNKFELEVEDSITVDKLLTKLKFSKQHKKFLNCSVNNKIVDFNYKLKHNDKVMILMPIGGG